MANSERLAASEPFHLLPEDRSSHIPVNSIPSAVTGLLSQSRLPLCFTPRRTQHFCPEHEIPLQQPENDTKKSSFCVIWTVSLTCLCAERTKLLPLPHIFLLLPGSFNRIIIVPSFIKCDRLVSASFFSEPCALRSRHTVHWSTKQIEQMFLTLCVMPRPQNVSVGYAVRG